MKVSVCIGNDKWSIPYSDKDKVRDILDLAVARYAKHAVKVGKIMMLFCMMILLIADAVIDWPGWLVCSKVNPPTAACGLSDQKVYVVLSYGDDEVCVYDF